MIVPQLVELDIFLEAFERGVPGELLEPGDVHALRDAARDRAAAEASGARGADAELHRFRGDLLRRLPSPERTEVEGCFHRALAIAREQGTRGFELRAAVSFARLLSELGRRAEACDLLAPIYGWFTEGFHTADLREAKALLDQLNEPAIAAEG